MSASSNPPSTEAYTCLPVMLKWICPGFETCSGMRVAATRRQILAAMTEAGGACLSGHLHPSDHSRRRCLCRRLGENTLELPETGFYLDCCNRERKMPF